MLTFVPGRMGGSESYARGLSRELASRGDGDDVIAFVSTVGGDVGEGLPTQIVPEFPLGRTASTRAAAFAVGALRRRRIRAHFDGCDVVHYPFTVPAPSLSAPTVITLHDVQHLDLPANFPPHVRAFRRLAYYRAARLADVVVVPSDFVLSRVEELLGVDRRRVAVVPHGIDRSTFFPDGDSREAFLLYPARVWPHKNHARLLTAFARVRRDRPELRLVLTGAGTERFAGQPGVDALGVVTIGELAALYRRASCVVFPSLYEGFGSPPLEGMACGAPAAVSTAGALPEICGDAAVLFDPKDPAAIAVGIHEALDRADELSALGLQRAARFTWAGSADGHMAAYRSAAIAR
jgi:glycosyltransferase involved in cell wall biosynthesis